MRGKKLKETGIHSKSEIGLAAVDLTQQVNKDSFPTKYLSEKIMFRRKIKTLRNRIICVRTLLYSYCYWGKNRFQREQVLN